MSAGSLTAKVEPGPARRPESGPAVRRSFRAGRCSGSRRPRRVRPGRRAGARKSYKPPEKMGEMLEPDVQAVVRYAAEHQVPLTPRGAGTGAAGGALGTGLVLDFSRHFREVVEIGGDTVRVQPGVPHAELNARLARHGRRFVPQPANPA